jgi:acyl carrier protein
LERFGVGDFSIWITSIYNDNLHKITKIMTQDKNQQKKLIIEIMESDEKDGLYETVTNDHSLTAVEWLIKKLYDEWGISIPDEAIIQVKQMERSEIEIAYETGWVNGDLKKYPRYGKDYYNDNLK